MTRDIGNEFEFPNTAMAVTKNCGRFLRRNNLDMAVPTRYETKVWIRKMTGIMANSGSLSGVNWEAILVKTVRHISKALKDENASAYSDMA
jgi:hypothetical protein